MNELQVTKLSGQGRGQPRTFATSPVSLGTAAGSDFKFDPAWDKTVSQRHAFLEWNGRQWVVTDAGSRDGTLVNGQRISSPTPVGAGVEIELGAGGPKLKLVELQPAAVSVAPGAGTTAGAGATAPTGKSAGPAKWLRLGAPLLLLAAVAAALVLAWRNRGGADKALAEAAKTNENCVGLVVLSGKDRDGRPVKFPMATAWAISENVLATNSHVTAPVKQHLDKQGACFIVLNKNPELKYRVTKAVVHPKYGQPLNNIDGKDPAVPAYDVGLLYVEGKLPNHFKIASAGELAALDSGYRIAYLGFPMEGIAGGGVDAANPVATMQSGIVTAVTDFWLSKADAASRLLVAHNLGATGGSSGSPVFNERGEVIAILSAGNIIGQVVVRDDGSMEPTRAPSGVLINYAQRIDILKDIYPEYPK